jgi:GNAT superfamily N-acetyltransferase
MADDRRVATVELWVRPNHRRARHRSGVAVIAAWTALYVSPGEPTQAWPDSTIVDPDHRGHRLGLLIELQNLYRAREREPDLRRIDTWNATENQHMIEINEAIGLRPADGRVN